MEITIPVEEGQPYTLGSFQVEGGKIFRRRVWSGLRVRVGETYNNKIIDGRHREGPGGIPELRLRLRLCQRVVGRREGEERIVDVAVNVFEGDRFRLGRLEFVGNTTTRDKVLRREFRIAEGQYMNMGLFRASVFKVNALGYWKLEEEPLEFDFDDENKRVNVKVKGNEVGRNDVQFGAGYSELEASSFRASSTPGTSSVAATRSGFRSRSVGDPTSTP